MESSVYVGLSSKLDGILEWNKGVCVWIKIPGFCRQYCFFVLQNTGGDCLLQGEHPNLNDALTTSTQSGLGVTRGQWG